MVQPLHGLLPLLPSTHPSPSLGKPSASILALSTVLCRAENQYNSNIFIFICSDCYIYLVLCNFPAPGSALLLGKQPGVLPAKEAEGKAITSVCFQCMTNSETFNGASMQ